MRGPGRRHGRGRRRGGRDRAASLLLRAVRLRGPRPGAPAGARGLARRAGPLRGGAGRRLRPGGGRRARARGGRGRDPQRHRPALQPADLRRRVRRAVHLPRHGDDALAAPPGAPLRGDRRQARRRAVRAGRALARGGAPRPLRDRRRAGPVGPLRPLRRRPSLLRARRGLDPRRREPRRRRLRLRAHVLDLDDDRGVPEPAARLGAGARLVHDGAVLGARAVRLPGGDRPRRVRQRRARGGGARAALPRLPAGHVQVRPRRGVHRRPAHAAQARAGLHRAGARARRRGRAAGRASPRRCPTRRRSATG